MVYELKKHTKSPRETILAVDFDGTVVPHDFPNIGDPLDGAIQTLKDLKNAGYTLIMWTCRESHYLVDAINCCRAQGIEFRSINHNTNEDEWAGSRKIYADVYIDDKNVGGFIGWDKIRKILLPTINDKGVIYDIYSIKENHVGLPVKIYEYKPELIGNKDLVEVLGDWLRSTLNDPPTILLNKPTNTALCDGVMYFIRKHDSLVSINSAVQDKQKID